MNKTIDINCDLGEGSGNDYSVMPYVSSCSIACGGHFGDRESVAKTLEYAKEFGVKTGAHPAYPDRENFGRRSMAIAPNVLQDALREQLDLFFSLCTSVNHIKPHGALYNDLFFDAKKANAVVEVIKEYDAKLKVYCAPKSIFSTIAMEAGLVVVYEGFGDRAYDEKGQLVSRQTQGSVFTQKEAIAKQVLRLIEQESVMTLKGNILPFKVQSICIHGDGKNVVENLQHLKKSLTENKIDVQSL